MTEDSTRTGIVRAVGGTTKVVRSISFNRLIGKLRSPGSKRRVLIAETGSHLSGGYKHLVPRANDPRPSSIERDFDDVLRRHLWLVDRRYRLRMSIHGRVTPIELRGVHRGQMHH